MRKIRIGKDINLRWHIEVPDGSGPLSDMGLVLYMNGPQGMHVLIENATIGVDTIEFTLRGTLFSQLGDYSLTLWKNKGLEGQTVLDARKAFRLVSSTDQEDSTPTCGCERLETSTVDLRTELQIDFLGYFNDPAIIARIEALEARVEALERQEDSIVLTGSLSYPGTAPASGGTLAPTSSLTLLKNGIDQSVTFSYASDRSYATVNSTTGVVTFQSSQSSTARTATITASCVFEGRTYSRTATVTQVAYVPPVVEEYVYAGSAKNTTSDPVSISGFIAGASSTTKTVNYTPTELVNTIIAVCPSTMSLTSCVKHGEIEDDITAEMLASVTNVTYESKSCKMYQFKYGSSIKNNAFTITFN